jgi:hypothetical protein
VFDNRQDAAEIMVQGFTTLRNFLVATGETINVSTRYTRWNADSLGGKKKR